MIVKNAQFEILMSEKSDHKLISNIRQLLTIDTHDNVGISIFLSEKIWMLELQQAVMKSSGEKRK